MCLDQGSNPCSSTFNIDLPDVKFREVFYYKPFNNTGKFKRNAEEIRGKKYV